MRTATAPKTRLLLAFLTVAMLGSTLLACGGSSKDAGSRSRTSSAGSPSGPATTTATSGRYSKSDGDGDNDDAPGGNTQADNDDSSLLASYGAEVDQSERQTVTRLVKSYYAAAVAGNGAQGCSLLYASFAQGVAEEHGGSAGGGTTCARALSFLYKQQHRRLLADEVATMGVTDVRAKGNFGLAVLGFRRMPEGVVLIEREGAAWKIDALLDSAVP